MNKKSRNTIIGIIFIALLLGVLAYTGKISNPFAITYNGAEVKYTVPLMGSIRCESIEKASQSYIIPSNGYWIYSGGIGARTDQVNSIKLTVSESPQLTYILGGFRVYYKICDQKAMNSFNCREGTQSIDMNGQTITISGIPSTIDLRTSSIFILIQGRKTFLSSWEGVSSNARVSYSYDKYGLVLYSPVGVGIGTICYSGCNLNCPSIGVRQAIISTPNDELTTFAPGNVVNYIQTWVDVSDMGEQLGGTTWNPLNQKFCFGGFIYSAGTIETETGTKYIYPKTYETRKDCCPGAVISAPLEDKICQSDYTWKTISKDTRIKCTSDFQCPNSGTPVCRDKSLSGWSCSGYDSSIGKFCKENTGTSVACCNSQDCATDQVCSNYKCEGGAIIPPTPQYECISDSNCKSNEKCISGVCKSNSTDSSECNIFQTEKIQNDYRYSWYNYVGIGNPQLVQTPYCATAGWVFAVIAGIVIVLIVGLITYAIVGKNRRKRK